MFPTKGTQASTVPEALSESGQTRHNKGCNCKKSKCLKKYCECFQAGIICNQYCKCSGCKNFEGCEERIQLLEHQKQVAAALNEDSHMQHSQLSTTPKHEPFAMDFGQP